VGRARPASAWLGLACIAAGDNLARGGPFLPRCRLLLVRDPVLMAGLDANASSSAGAHTSMASMMVTAAKCGVVRSRRYSSRNRTATFLGANARERTAFQLPSTPPALTHGREPCRGGRPSLAHTVLHRSDVVVANSGTCRCVGSMRVAACCLSTLTLSRPGRRRVGNTSAPQHMLLLPERADGHASYCHLLLSPNAVSLSFGLTQMMRMRQSSGYPTPGGSSLAMRSTRIPLPPRRARTTAWGRVRAMATHRTILSTREALTDACVPPSLPYISPTPPPAVMYTDGS
jgi:hypothetical protein